MHRCKVAFYILSVVMCMGKISFPKNTGTGFLVLPSGGVYVLAGKTECAPAGFRDGRAKTSIFFVR
jgi:hypothetical protein